MSHLIRGKKPQSRVIGHVFAAPPLTYDQPYREDWALIRLHNVEAQNAIYVGEQLEATPRALLAKMRQPASSPFNRDSRHMVSITHISPAAQAQMCGQDVMMRASASGLSFGRTTGTSSIRRVYKGREMITTEYAIVGNDGCAFSRKGDSGGAVVSSDGGVIGMVTSGAGKTEATDVTYATPLWWVLERCKALTGQTFSLL